MIATLEITEQDLLLPKIENEYNWYIKDFKKKSKLITYIAGDDIRNLNIRDKRPHATPAKHANVWTTSSPNTILGYMHDIENAGSDLTMSLEHVLWFTDNHPKLLNSEEKNEKNQYIGNFFFIPKNEFHKENGVWSGEIAVASVMRRNSTPNLEFGLRFYDINDPRIWKAKDRRIISLS